MHNVSLLTLSYCAHGPPFSRRPFYRFMLRSFGGSANRPFDGGVVSWAVCRRGSANRPFDGGVVSWAVCRRGKVRARIANSPSISSFSESHSYSTSLSIRVSFSMKPSVVLLPTGSGEALWLLQSDPLSRQVRKSGAPPRPKALDWGRLMAYNSDSAGNYPNAIEVCLA